MGRLLRPRRTHCRDDDIFCCLPNIGLPIRSHLRLLLKDVDDKDARKIVHKTVMYWTNNRQRMNYPKYRQQCVVLPSSEIFTMNFARRQCR